MSKTTPNHPQDEERETRVAPASSGEGVAAAVVEDSHQPHEVMTHLIAAISSSAKEPLVFWTDDPSRSLSENEAGGLAVFLNAVGVEAVSVAVEEKTAERPPKYFGILVKTAMDTRTVTTVMRERIAGSRNPDELRDHLNYLAANRVLKIIPVRRLVESGSTLTILFDSSLPQDFYTPIPPSDGIFSSVKDLEVAKKHLVRLEAQWPAFGAVRRLFDKTAKQVSDNEGSTSDSRVVRKPPKWSRERGTSLRFFTEHWLPYAQANGKFSSDLLRDDLHLYNALVAHQRRFGRSITDLIPSKPAALPDNPEEASALEKHRARHRKIMRRSRARARKQKTSGPAHG